MRNGKLPAFLIALMLLVFAAGLFQSYIHTSGVPW